MNAICPGFIRTPLAVRRDEERIVAGVVAGQPWPSVGEAADIAAACLFLASDDAGFVTGEALTVDGGLLAAGPDLTGKVDPQRRVRNGASACSLRLDRRPPRGPSPRLTATPRHFPGSRPVDAASGRASWCT